MLVHLGEYWVVLANDPQWVIDSISSYVWSLVFILLMIYDVNLICMYKIESI